MRKLLSLLTVAVMLLGPAPAVATAAPPQQVSALCDGAPDGCGIRVDTWMREGATYPVTVQGRPGARVRVVIYAASLDDGRVTALTPVASGDEVFVGSSGTVSTRVAIPPVTDDLSGGWALVSLEGVTLAGLADTVGGWVPFGSRIPTLLGDGYAEDKPVGRPLELSLVGTIPGSKFAVDYADASGIWRDATAPDAANEPAARPDEVATVSYVVPRGLSPQAYTFRLRNLTSGTSEATWSVVPSATGVERERTSWTEPAPPGLQVDGVVAVTPHPDALVKAVAAGVGGAALLIVGVGLPLARRRGGLDG